MAGWTTENIESAAREIRLTGTDLLGNRVDLSTRTDGDGSYHFTDLLRGQYRLIEFQPTYMIDGYDTHQGRTLAAK